MKITRIFFGLALGSILVQTLAAQGERVPSSWTPSAVSTESRPRGYAEYEKFCSQCHGEGVGKPGTLALAAKYKGEKPALLAERTDLTPGIVRVFVRNGVLVMPFFRKTEISDADLDAITAYLTRNNKR